MQRLFSMFPDGRAGAALGLMRVSSAATLLCVVLRTGATPSWPVGVAIGVSALLVAGLFTPVLAVSAAAALLLLAPTDPLALAASAQAVALALLGPGAFSVDARLFGRRRVLLRG